MPSVTSIINKVKREVQIHENYLNYLINSELDVTREQILDNGIKINVALAKSSPISIDTKEDYLALKKIMEYKS